LAIDDGPILDTLLGKFGMVGKLVGNEIDPDTEDFLFPHNNTYFLLTKDEKGRAALMKALATSFCKKL